MKKLIFGFVLIGFILIISSCDKKDETYHIHFDSKGGSEFFDITAPAGKEVELPIPEKDGYLFYKWQSNGIFYNNDSITVSQDMTFEAIWEDVTEVFTYEIDGYDLSIQSYNGNIRDITIPQEIDGHPVTIIDMNAFKKSPITSIKIPNSVRSVNAGAFSETTNLESVTFYGEYSGLLEILHMTSINYDAIINANSNDCIKSADPASPNDESKWIFSDECPIKKVLGKTQPIIGPDQQAYFTYHVVVNLANFTDSDQIIGQAFVGSSVKNITLPDRLNSVIGCVGCLRGATNLEEVLVSNENLNYQSIDGILYSKDMTKLIAYPEGKKDENYTLPETLVSTADIAFNGNAYLKSITIPKNSNIEIQANLFYSLDALKTYIVEDGSEDYSTIDGVLFNHDQTKLIAYPASKTTASYLVPNGITTIGTYAFYEAKNLTSIVIPSDVSIINSGAFGNADALTEIVLNGDTVKAIGDYGNNLFGRHHEDLVIYVPDSLVDDYKTSIWQNYADIIKPISEKPYTK